MIKNQGTCATFLAFWAFTGPCVQATPSFFEKHARGWHWYESLEVAREEDKQQNLTPPQLTSTQQIEAQRKELETKLHTAIIRPTHENVMTYIIAQRALMNQSQRFSEAWKQVVMTVSALDETLIHPTDQNARHVYYDLKNKERTARIAALSQEYGLFFFFKNKCPYCHGFAPLVKRFSEKYGWSVLAVSLDGEKLLEFPKSLRDNGIAARLQITHVPALIALHPRTGDVIPLAYGMISESEIEARVELLTTLIAGGKK